MIIARSISPPSGLKVLHFKCFVEQLLFLMKYSKDSLHNFRLNT